MATHEGSCYDGYDQVQDADQSVFLINSASICLSNDDVRIIYGKVHAIHILT